MSRALIPLIVEREGEDEDKDEDKIYNCISRKREHGLITAFGKIKIQRAIYSEYDTGGIKSFLDEKLDIEDKRHCLLMKYWTDLLGIVAPFDEARDTLNKIRTAAVT
ncbi:hypothetical protein GF327_02340 [Candidatus Woesearchaeota archaeon]|nr:hypothetical protein [Candidatus Woesearchaeota archaeon]